MPVSINFPSGGGISSKELDFLKNVSPITKVQDYLYEITYNSLDWEYGKKFMEEQYTDNSGGCSSIRRDNFYGRNYDWSYDECAYFVIRVNKSKTTKYSSIGMTGGSFKELTKDFVESGKYSDLYRVLPFITVDGINECGVVMSSNVVPAGDMGITTGTTPTESLEDTMCVKMLIRYVLDNFATAAEAVDHIKKHISVYAPNKEDGLKQELHLMVADKDDTYVIEFINNEVVVSDMDVAYSGRTYMTNFYLQDTYLDTDRHIVYDSVTDYGAGLERYDIITSSIRNVNSLSTMTDLLYSLYYTNTYLPLTNPVWRTEFVDKDLGLKVTSPASAFNNIIAAAQQAYLTRTRNGQLWQTCHSAVYDIENRVLNLLVQEENKENQKHFTYKPWSTDIVGKRTATGGEIFNSATDAGLNAHAEGTNTAAQGDSSHAGGTSTAARADNSFAHGDNVLATDDNSTAFGRYNNIDGDYAFMIGNGYQEGTVFVRSNALAIDWEGKFYVNNSTTGIDVSKLIIPTTEEEFIAMAEAGTLIPGSLYVAPEEV